MYDELTRSDLQKMQEEIDYRTRQLRPKLIEDKSDETTAGLYDTVEILMENTGKTRRITLVTTLRQDALKGLISKESPVGRAVLGCKAGDRVQVQMENGSTYWLQIQSVEKGTDDGSIPIGSF